MSNEQISEPSTQIPDHSLAPADEAVTTPATVAVEPISPPWDPLTSLGLWILSVFLVFLLPNLIVLPYILLRYWGAPDVAQAVMKDPTALLLSVLGVIPAHLLTLGVAWAIVTQNGKRPFWRTIGWSWSGRFRFWTCAGFALALYLIGVVLAKLIGGEATDIDILANSSLPTRLVLAGVATATGPLVEEIIYRGVLFPALQRKIGLVGAVVLVSFLFTLVHIYQYRNNLGVITVIALLSVSLTLVRALTGRLLPCFVIHMIFNGVTSVIIVFYPYVEQFEKGRLKTGVAIVLRQMLQTLA